MLASKAFDRLHFGKLFTILIEHKLLAVIIPILLESYISEDVKISWNNKLSGSFKSTNGDKQGCVLSPVLFSIYIDKLLKLLSESGFGCKIGRQYFGVAVYADDIILFSPTITGLQSMVNICLEFGTKYNVPLMKKRHNVFSLDAICVIFIKYIHRRRKTSRFQKVKYLGNCLNTQLDDSGDLLYYK